mgnify:CR=1 FL=1
MTIWSRGSGKTANFIQAIFIASPLVFLFFGYYLPVSIYIASVGGLFLINHFIPGIAGSLVLILILGLCLSTFYLMH